MAMVLPDTQKPPAVQPSLAEIRQALAAGDLEGAIARAEAALSRGEAHPLILNLAAHRLQTEGRLGRALDLLHQALDIDPNDAFVLNSIGNCFSQLGIADQALLAFDSALSVQPDLAQAHHGRGLALAMLGDRPGAYRAHRQAAALAPAYAEPVGALAALLVEDHEPIAAREQAFRALAMDPQQTAAVLSLATLEFRDGDFEAVLERVDARLALGGMPPFHRSSALRLKADALDALGRPLEAMEAYAAANRVLREVHDPESGDAPELGVERVRRLLKHFEGAAGDWGAAPTRRDAGSDPSGHVFLVGFPRSGTTLLEQILAGHSQIVTLEERPTLDPAIESYFADDAGLDRLRRMGVDQADVERDAYWARVRNFGAEPAGKVFVDKMPLNTLYLPLVAKLFPRAKVILAIRDPRDVVLSCFQRRFRANAMVIEFTDLARTAELYDGVMRLATVYRELLPLPIHEHRHERLVEDLEAESRRLCGFLDLPWEAGMLQFVETANRRDIRTPSAPQVRRGLNRDGVGKWRRYAACLAPVMPQLAHWVDAFRYSAD